LRSAAGELKEGLGGGVQVGVRSAGAVPSVGAGLSALGGDSAPAGR